jgi:hypothetical protein
MTPVADGVDDLTPEWLSAALGRSVTAVTAERIGTGQIGTSHRLGLTYDGEAGPSTLVAKLAGGDPAARDRVKDGFAKEVGFYLELADTVDVRRPGCWYGAITADKTSFTLLLDDLAPSVPGVQADGCSVAQAADAVRNVAGLHAPRWDDESLLDVGFLAPTNTPEAAAFLGEILKTATGQFAERYEAGLPTEDVTTLHEVADAIAAWQLARPRPLGIVHGDYRLDNLMFPPEGDGVVALDWQTVTVGPPLRDVSYFLGTSLVPELRRTHEEELVRGYHEALRDRGVDGYGWDDCWADYRLGHLQGPMITVLGAIYATAERSERADGMFLAMATRSCAAIRELRTLELL